MKQNHLSVASSRNKNREERYKERPLDVERLGMDIGDYDYIDGLFHCPMVDWVQ